MRMIFGEGLAQIAIREFNELRESGTPFRGIRNVRGQSISLFGSSFAGLGIWSLKAMVSRRGS
jgi:hypothetical protein